MAVAADLHRDFLIPGLCSFNKQRIAALFLTYSLAVGNYVFGRAAPVRLALHHFLNEQLTHSGKRRIAALFLTYSLAVGNYVFGRAAPVRLALHHFLNEQLNSFR